MARSSLAASRAALLVRAVALILGLATSAAVLRLHPIALPISAYTGAFIVAGVAMFVVACVIHGSLWLRWLLFVRVWLPSTGRLPWRLLRFLDDAARRGVLRRTGALYSFRDVRFIRMLALPPRGAPAGSPDGADPIQEGAEFVGEFAQEGVEAALDAAVPHLHLPHF